MNPHKPSAQRSGPAKPVRDDVPDRTPNPDMQTDDAGTAASGNDAPATRTEPALKQAAKTPAEARDRRQPTSPDTEDTR
jgi:hypothetical protein